MNYLSKLKHLREAKQIVENLKKEGKKIIFTNGCFDILHVGHVRYLNDAKKYGDFLIVGINSDSSVRRIKGENRPIIDEKARAEVVAGLDSVDMVIIFSEDTPYELIKTLEPDVLIKGGDWKEEEIVGADIVKRSGGKVLTVPYISGYSTTSIIEKIIRLYCK
jgi:D-beta-D-heptose 7-phosphate kinase/D-beta-D-heptose 1-phosphate adenosyltransferase